MNGQFPRSGRLEWIGLTPAKRADLVPVHEVEVTVGTGLAGDRHAANGKGGRQVTLVQAEHLPVIASLVGRPVAAGDLRRNLLVSGINLYALRRSRFRVGEVLLEGTGTCDPCDRMEENLGAGGFNACRGHGGITARVVEPGRIRLGDSVVFIGDPTPAAADKS